EDVSEGDRGEDPRRHPEGGRGAEPPFERARGQEGGESEEQGVGNRRAAGGGEAQEWGDPERVGGRLGVDERAAAVTALEDQAVRRRAPLGDEAVVVLAR